MNLKREQSNVFFKLIEERYHRHSTIITTNLGYEEWPTFPGNQSMVEALLSRVRHYCHTVEIKGPSIRTRKVEGLWNVLIMCVWFLTRIVPRPVWLALYVAPIGCWPLSYMNAVYRLKR